MKICPQCRASYPNEHQFCPHDQSPLRMAGELAPGMVVRGKWEILEKLGQGGMASVFKARHVDFGELRALKVINPQLAEDAEFLRRFKSEAILAKRVAHPNVARIDDLDATEDGLPFIVMELIDGESLRRRIARRGPLPVAEAVDILRQAAAALGAAHALGVTHRDVKPDNILIVETPQGPLVKAADFGIAKAAAREGLDAVTHGTQTGMLVGTPDYMSPEQALGRHGDALDGRSDLYSLGVVFYEMLTGRLPFRADTPVGMALQHVSSAPAPPQTLRPELAAAPRLTSLLMRLLAKNPEERPQTAEALLRDLDEWTASSANDAATQPTLVSAPAPSASKPAAPASASPANDERGASPWLAAALGFVPGLGSACNRQWAKAAAYCVAFGLAVLAQVYVCNELTLSGCLPALALILHSMADAWSTAWARRLGLPHSTFWLCGFFLGPLRRRGQAYVGDRAERRALRRAARNRWRWLSLSLMLTASAVGALSLAKRVGEWIEPAHYRLHGARLLFTLPPGEGVADLSFSPDGRYLKGYLQSGKLRVWEAESGAVVGDYAFFSPTASLAAFSSDGSLLAIEGKGRGVAFLRVVGGAVTQSFNGAGGFVTAMAFSRDDRLFAFSDAVGEVSVASLWWDEASRTRLAIRKGLTPGDEEPSPPSLSSEENAKLPGAPRSQQYTGLCHNHIVLFLVFARDGQSLTLACGDKSVQTLFLGDPSASPPADVLSAPASENAVNLFPSMDGSAAMTMEANGGACRHLRIASRRLSDCSLPGADLISPALSPDGRYVVFMRPAQGGARAALWDDETGGFVDSRFGRMRISSSSALISPDDRRILWVSGDRVYALDDWL